MKYWILKIVGILGLVATPIIMNSLYPFVKETGSIVARETWFQGCEIFLILFLVVTMAGFSRSIAKIKAFIDFHTDFDDDQDLDGYPKLKIYSFVKKILAIVSVVAIIVISLLRKKVAFIDNNLKYIVFSIVAVVFVLFLVNIIICFAKKIVPLHFDTSIVFAIFAFVLEALLIHFGCNEIVAALISVPFFALAALYFACSIDELISIDELFDWLCYEEYEKHYSMLCEKEKSQEAQAKIEKKVSVRNARKTRRKNIKGKKKSSTKKEKQ